SENEPRESAILHRISEDPSALVRYANASATYSEAQGFFALPMEARLVAVCGDSVPGGEKFAEWIKLGLANQAASEDDLLDVLVEYLRNPKLKETSELEDIDVLSWHIISQDFNALWNLVPIVPKSLAFELVSKLPWQASFGAGYQMPEDMLHWLERS